MIPRSLILTALTAPLLHAQDGGQLYTTYCSACHGTNGEGALNGQFPPLAGSPWPTGNADRAIKIVLHGLHGEVDVNGRTWNLEMPPQGAVLPDDQIAAILTYVRKSWGNDSPAVNEASVKAVRAANSNRAQPWTSEEILKDHPLDQKAPLKDLISYLYKGKWTSIPDFTGLKANAVEEEHKGFISLSKIREKNDYGVVWLGTLEVPGDGDYEFQLDADDGARLSVDEKKLIEITGIGPIGGRQKIVPVNLTKGDHKLRVEYHQAQGNQEIRAGWRKKGTEPWISFTDHKVASKKWPDIPIIPEKGRPAVYRNFIEGSTPRSIGVGFDGGVNFSWSAEHQGPEIVWTGKFMDGGHHWTDRGQGFEPPAGDRIVIVSNIPALLSVAQCADGLDKKSDLEPRFRGYKFDKDGNPTFVTTLMGNATVRDSFAASVTPKGQALIRTITSSGSGQPILLNVTNAKGLKPSGEGIWTTDGGLTIQVQGSNTMMLSDALLATLNQDSPVVITYRWN